ADNTTAEREWLQPRGAEVCGAGIPARARPATACLQYPDGQPSERSCRSGRCNSSHSASSLVPRRALSQQRVAAARERKRSSATARNSTPRAAPFIIFVSHFRAHLACVGLRARIKGPFGTRRQNLRTAPRQAQTD